MKMLTVGIDASNVRAGGGLTHLIEVLGAARPQVHGIGRVVVWAPESTRRRFERSTWLDAPPVPALQGWVRRLAWQRFGLSRAAKRAGCDVLWVPGGVWLGRFRPVVAMSQNNLPFEPAELRRFGISLATLRYLILRRAQARTFRRADGVIFLSRFARMVVERATGPITVPVTLVPHGIARRFFIAPRPQQPLGADDRVVRVLYVSIVNHYKHQWHVAEATALLRSRGYRVALDLIGPSEPRALVRLRRTMARLDPAGQWVRYHGAADHASLHAIYRAADVGVFASSCENLPIILLEMLAAGLPVACSDRGPMPEVLGDCGLYFDPEDPVQIAAAIERYLVSPELRAGLADCGHRRAAAFSWERAAADTFGFLAAIARSTANS